MSGRGLIVADAPIGELRERLAEISRPAEILGQQRPGRRAVGDRRAGRNGASSRRLRQSRRPVPVVRGVVEQQQGRAAGLEIEEAVRHIGERHPEP